MPGGTLLACAFAGYLASDPTARTALEVASQHLAACPSVRVDYTVRGPDGKTLDRRSIAVAASGIYSEFYFDPPPAGEAGEPRRAGFLFFDGTALRQSRAGNAEVYEMVEAPGHARTPPGPMQWLMAPWPIAPIYVEWLAHAPDLIVETGDEMTWFRSASAGLALGLTRSGLIRSIRREYAAGGFHQFDFDGYKPSPGGIFPTRMTWSASLTSSTTGKATQFVRQFTAECRSPADLADLEFDAMTINAARYDPATGDVIHPRHGLLYNLKQVEAEMNASSWYYRLRPWAFGAAGVGVAASVYIGYRRLRSSS